MRGGSIRVSSRSAVVRFMSSMVEGSRGIRVVSIYSVSSLVGSFIVKVSS